MRCRLLLIMLCIPFWAQAQVNLVPNSSFESYGACPLWPAEFGKVDNWFKAQDFWGSPDYLHACGTVLTGVPVNVFGQQDARTGNAYAGIYFSTSIYFREFIGVRLKEPMLPGSVYYASAWFSSGDFYTESVSGIDALGLLFHTDSMKFPTYTGLPIMPQIHGTYGTPLYNDSSWVLLDGFVCPDTNFNYVYIGGFAPMMYWTVGGGLLANNSYYYIEDVQVFKFEVPGFDTLICDSSEFVTVNISHPKASGYTWNDGSTDSVRNLGPGHWLYNIDVGDCIYTDSILIDVPDLPPPGFLGQDTTICLGEPLLIDGGWGSIDPVWNSTDTLPVQDLSAGGLFWAHWGSEGCYVYDSILVSIDSCLPPVDPPEPVICHTTMPNAFSPDGDGINDSFGPPYNCELTEFEMHITNRWGETVFVSFDQKKRWDGTHLGISQNVGTYIWVMQFREGESPRKTLAGTVTLLR